MEVNPNNLKDVEDEKDRKLLEEFFNISTSVHVMLNLANTNQKNIFQSATKFLHDKLMQFVYDNMNLVPQQKAHVHKIIEHLKIINGYLGKLYFDLPTEQENTSSNNSAHFILKILADVKKETQKLREVKVKYDNDPQLPLPIGVNTEDPEKLVSIYRYLPNSVKKIDPSLKEIKVGFFPGKNISMKTSTEKTHYFTLQLDKKFLEENDENTRFSFGFGTICDYNITDPFLKNPDFYIRAIGNNFFLKSIGTTSLKLKIQKGWFTQLSNQDVIHFETTDCNISLRILECNVPNRITKKLDYVLYPRWFENDENKFIVFNPLSKPSLRGELTYKTIKKNISSDGSSILFGSGFNADCKIDVLLPTHFGIFYSPEIGFYLINLSENETYLGLQKHDFDVSDDYLLPIFKGIEIKGGSCTTLLFE